MTRNDRLDVLTDAMVGRPIDLFIGAASFEQRCLSVPKRLDMSRVEIKKAIIFRNMTYFSAFKKNFNAMQKLFGERLVPVGLSSDDPVASAYNIAEVLDGEFEAPGKRVVVDITTFTRESLLVLLWVLRRNMQASDTIEFLYVPAREYSFGDPVDRKWLSKGIRTVRSVLGFPGQMNPAQPTHMMVMVGFEFERTVELLRVCEPAFVSLGFADPSESGTVFHQEKNEEIVKKLRQILVEVDSFTFKAYDVGATKEALDGQMRKYPKHNVVVAPMNTKISTVGASLFAFEHEKVQLCYASANIYNVENYSIPGDDYYWFTLTEFAGI